MHRLDEAIRALPPALQRPLRECAAGDLPANVAAMCLLMESRAAGEAERAVADLLARLDGQAHAPAARRLQAVLTHLRGNPQAWRTVRTVLDDVRHDDAATSPDEQIRRLAAAFDKAAQASPEGSVALYALGNPELLRAATAEVVQRLREWDLLGRDRTVLDLGCGIGRFAEALSPDVKSIVGVDISTEMVEAARRRCACLANASFLQTSGHDLSVFGEASFDLVLAADTLPYLVQSGMSLVETHFAEVARVLRPGGDLLVLNFSYRGEPDQDRADIRRLAETFGFEVLRQGVSAFSLWDGLAFHLVKGGRR
jgi:ubiquinone/menaquinone biosynthesis C-methylase UbiE